MEEGKTYDVRNINEELAKCDLKFSEQCKLVWEGAKKGFSYDGCTAVPDFDFGYDCCGEHDYHYQARDISRAEADEKLRKCILAKGIPSSILGIPYNSSWFLAGAYYLGVRIFGGFFWYKRKKQSEKDLNSDPRA
jgi:hypothetical protein